MEMTEIAGAIALIGGLITIGAYFNKKVKDSSDSLKALMKVSIEANEKVRLSDMSSVGRTLDTLRESIEADKAELAIHSHKISQSDIIMAHLDETLKSVGSAMTKLDETLNALQIVVARIDSKS